jgi:hypothetical protein
MKKFYFCWIAVLHILLLNIWNQKMENGIDIFTKKYYCTYETIDQGTIRSFKAYYRRALLTVLLTQSCKCHSSWKQLHLIIWPTISDWNGKNISSITIKYCWSKCIAATGDSVKHEEEFSGFTEEDEREASNTLQVNELWAWVREDDEISVAVYKDDEEIVAEILNSGRAEYLSEWRNVWARDP